VQSEAKEETSIDLTNDGEEQVYAGGSNKGDDGNKPGSGEGGSVANGKANDGPIESRLLVKVNLKVAAEKEEEILYHNLIVTTEKNIARAELELLVSGDNEKDDGLEIYTTDKGHVQGNKLKGIKLLAGKNQIKIRFSDNLKHSIKIKAYELQ
jgi:hypothetical protein